MWVSRVRVTGGYLADFDAQLRPGLNVVIGPRGAGKTTLLELIRHGLGIQHADVSKEALQRRRVREMLGDGEVILDVESAQDSVRVVVDAQGAGRRPELSATALMLGQNELESIASDAASRLTLVDLRAQVAPTAPQTKALAAATERLADLRSRAADLREQLRQRSSLQADFEQASADEGELMQRASAELTAQRMALTALEDRLIAEQRSVAMTSRSLGELQALEDTGVELRRRLIDLRRTSLPPELAATLEPVFLVSQNAIESLGANLAGASSTVRSFIERGQAIDLQLRADAAPLRAVLEEAERGMGELTSRLRNLRAQLDRLDLVAEELALVDAEAKSVRAIRDGHLLALEEQQEKRFHARMDVAIHVSSQLGGNIAIVVEHLADYRDFRDRLAELLHGSGLQYRPAAEAIARTVLPGQLVQLVETGDAETLASLSGMPAERAARVIEYLDIPASLIAISESELRDRVDFLLRDGSTVKSVEQLSTGQKCAVTLPVLLTEHSRSLLLDQPEDHLDNAYLVENIVSAIEARNAAGSQTIVATHNANIPVLGSAEVVLSLKSDGTRGFLAASDSYDAKAIVREITTLMEGGEEAFRRRKEFYMSHGQRI